MRNNDTNSLRPMEKDEVISTLKELQSLATLCATSLQHHGVTELEATEEITYKISNDLYELYSSLERETECKQGRE